MVETRINISELKGEGGEIIKELTKYLKEKTNAEVETAATNEIVVKSQEEGVSRSYLRVLLRKFLHKNELKDYFRVIGGKENTLVVKEKKTYEEE
ncbi:MAG TPA: 60S ribosomal protein L22 [Candidatus Bathyarchaeia archaeon]